MEKKGGCFLWGDVGVIGLERRRAEGGRLPMSGGTGAVGSAMLVVCTRHGFTQAGRQAVTGMATDRQTASTGRD